MVRLYYDNGDDHILCGGVRIRPVESVLDSLPDRRDVLWDSLSRDAEEERGLIFAPEDRPVACQEVMEEIFDIGM